MKVVAKVGDIKLKKPTDYSIGFYLLMKTEV